MGSDSSGTSQIMKSCIECGQLGTNIKEVSVSMSEIKTESQDIRSEIKTEAEECDDNEICSFPYNVSNLCIPEYVKCEVKVGTEECGKFPKHIGIKSEIEPVSDHVGSIETIPEVKCIQGGLDNFLEDHNQKSQAEQNSEEHMCTDNVPVLNQSCETCITDLQKEKCDIYECGQNGENFTMFNSKMFQKINPNITAKGTHIHFNIIELCKHSGEKTFVCGFCGKSFSQKYHLSRHTRVHTKEKPFSCQICSKSFSQKYDLAQHTRIHTNEKPFACNFCSKQFSLKSNLAKHERTHSNEKPFTCNLCSKSFARRSTLVQHSRIHSNEKPYTCNICSKSFSQKSGLVLHTRIHTSERPYSCVICSKSFNQKYDLVQHIRIHTNEKPFLCSVCRKQFSQKSNFLKHKRTHSNEK